MLIVPPEQVLSPRDSVEVIEVLDAGTQESFALAIVAFEGVMNVGIRWNVAMREWDDESKIDESRRCVGMPSSRGYPVWFILPLDFLRMLMEGTRPEITSRIRELVLDGQGMG